MNVPVKIDVGDMTTGTTPGRLVINETLTGSLAVMFGNTVGVVALKLVKQLPMDAVAVVPVSETAVLYSATSVGALPKVT